MDSKYFLMASSFRFAMKENKKDRIIENPKFRVIFTWVFFIIGSLLVFLSFFLLFEFNIEKLTSKINNEPYLMVYVEFVGVGLIPLCFTIFHENDPFYYGVNFKKKALLQSLLFSLLLTTIFFIVGYLLQGTLMSDTRQSISAPFPLNIYYGIFGIFCWGPLEVFFFTWLIYETDLIYHSKNSLFSNGLMITTLLFGMAHVFTTGSIFNAVYTGSIFLILGIIFKYTRNSLGPMLAWTLINGQVWYIAQLLAWW